MMKDFFLILNRRVLFYWNIFVTFIIKLGVAYSNKVGFEVSQSTSVGTLFGWSEKPKLHSKDTFGLPEPSFFSASARRTRNSNLVI